MKVANFLALNPKQHINILETLQGGNSTLLDNSTNNDYRRSGSFSILIGNTQQGFHQKEICLV